MNVVLCWTAVVVLVGFATLTWRIKVLTDAAHPTPDPPTSTP